MCVHPFIVMFHLGKRDQRRFSYQTQEGGAGQDATKHLHSASLHNGAYQEPHPHLYMADLISSFCAFLRTNS